MPQGPITIRAATGDDAAAIAAIYAPFVLSGTVSFESDAPDAAAMRDRIAASDGYYPWLVATSGEAALQRAAQARPDIVLLDAMMPGMDGFEVARRLKADAATAHIPIVFMTGLTETEHLVAALEAGGVDYVTKPIKPKEVLARMNVHLQGARRARQEAQQAGQAVQDRGFAGSIRPAQCQHRTALRPQGEVVQHLPGAQGQAEPVEARHGVMRRTMRIRNGVARMATISSTLYGPPPPRVKVRTLQVQEP